jgi:TolA-binding protein
VFLAPLLLLLFVSAFPRRAPGQTPEERLAFEAAVRTLESGFAEKAAADFAQFIQHFPQSPLAAQAILLEGRARSQAGQLDAAAEGLGRRIDGLGGLKDQAYYLLGDVNLRRERFDEAAQAFRRVAADTPESPLAFKAAFSEALAVFRAGKYAQASDLLSHESEHFSRHSARQPEHELIPGKLLLAEAQLRANRAAAAQVTLDALAKASLSPAQAWEHAWLVTSLGLTNRQLDAAVVSSSNLLALATSAQSADLIARSHAFKGDILRQAGRTREAFSALTNNLAAETPPEWRRDAVLAIVELPLNSPQVPPAIELLSRLTAGPPSDPTVTATRVVVAELQLQRHFEGPEPGSTNGLAEARQLLQSVLSNKPPARLEGRAWFNLGWAELARRDLAAATSAFEHASRLLAPSALQALAFFKLADCQQRPASTGWPLPTICG